MNKSIRTRGLLLDAKKVQKIATSKRIMSAHQLNVEIRNYMDIYCSADFDHETTKAGSKAWNGESRLDIKYLEIVAMVLLGTTDYTALLPSGSVELSWQSLRENRERYKTGMLKIELRSELETSA